MDFLFSSGMYKYEHKGWEVIASGASVSISLECVGDGYLVQADGPVLIKTSFINGKRLAELRVFENNKLIETRQGIISRSNPEQLVFRLNKTCDKALIVFK